MSRINTNVPSLVARSNLSRTHAELEVRLQRLSTGIRINRGADDPAGLIISERIRSDLRGTEQGIANAERASSVIATSEASLSEVNELLNSIRALVVEAANTGARSEDELRANQLQIDSAIESITRISNTATFGGLKLLNGQLDYSLSGVDETSISHTRVYGASFVGTGAVEVDIDVIASAQVGALYVRGDLPIPGAPQNGTILSSTTLRIAGNRGVTEISVTSGTTLAELAASVNSLTSYTGVTAELINPGDATSGLVFKSVDYGSKSFVSVQRQGGPSNPAQDSFKTYSIAGNQAVPGNPFPWSLVGSLLTEVAQDWGRNVTALVNGTVATGDGLTISINNPALSLELLLAKEFATDPTLTASSFHITGGGALFQLGPEVTAQQQVAMGIPSVASSRLGAVLVGNELQFLSSLKDGQPNSLKACADRNDFSPASDILGKSIDEVSVLRGRLGAFERNVLQPNMRSLQSVVENLTASDSRIRDADFAAETSRLTRAQILASAGTTVLSLANQQSQTVLQLLG